MAAFFGKVDLGWRLLDKMNLISGRRESVRGMGFYVCKVCFLGDFLWYGAFVFLAGASWGIAAVYKKHVCIKERRRCLCRLTHIRKLLPKF